MAADPEAYFFAGDGSVPNARLPLLLYRGAVPADPAAIERLFRANSWPPAWRNGVHPFHHFHANAHEALGIACGEATVLFGGPGGRALTVGVGDVAVVPAGVGHCRKAGSGDLLVIGAYPAGSPSPDLYRGRSEEYAEVVRLIATVPVPASDPVAGKNGPLLRFWP